MLTENVHYTPLGFIDSEDCSGKVVSGDCRSIVEGETGAMRAISTGHAFNTSTFNAKITRDSFKAYFNSIDGAVPWQNAHVNSIGSPI